jgi:Tfp pilus assembly protein PilP
MKNVRFHWLYAATFAASVVFAVHQIVFRPIVVEQPAATPRQAALPARDRVEPKVLAAAKKAGIKRVMTVTRRSDGKSLEVEWEGDAAAALRFVDVLQTEGTVGDCNRFQLSSAANKSALRAQATFNLANRPAPTAHAEPIHIPTLVAFGPAEKTPRIAKQPLRQPSLSSSETPKSGDAAAALEENRLMAKRQELETQLKLTGIVKNGQEAVAFVSLEGTDPKSVMVRQGDSLRDAQVVSIDDQKGELRLNYAGKFDVLVKLTPPQGT